MTEPNNMHWAENEELREQFVLGAISASRRVALEAHTQHCGECRRLVEEERAFALGIQKAGRESLRNELNDRIRTKGVSNIDGPWRWIAAAATIVAAIGVWRLMTPGEPSPLISPTTPRITEMESPASAPSDSMIVVGRDLRARDETRAPSQRYTQREMAEVTGSSMAEKPSGLDAAGAGARVDAAKMATSDVDEPIQAQAWTTGSWIASTSNAARSMIAQEQASKALTAEKKMKDETPATSQAGAGTKAHNVQIRQSSSALLPQEQIIVQRVDRSTFPVLLTQKGDSLLVDLYLDPPMTEDGIRTARYLLPKTDSLVVEIDRQRIAIQLPRGFFAR